MSISAQRRQFVFVLTNTYECSKLIFVITMVIHKIDFISGDIGGASHRSRINTLNHALLRFVIQSSRSSLRPTTTTTQQLKGAAQLPTLIGLLTKYAIKATKSERKH